MSATSLENQTAGAIQLPEQKAFFRHMRISLRPTRFRPAAP